MERRGSTTALADTLPGVAEEDPNTRILRARKELGLSQEYVAHLLGAAIRTYQRWERGEAVPRPKNLQRISEVLEIPLEELVQVPIDPGLAAQLDRRLTRIEQKLDLLMEQDAARYSALTEQEREMLSRFEELIQHIGRDIGRGRPQSRGEKPSAQANHLRAG